jgi:nucleotide-binding universal stress UspA family protein
MTDRDDAGDAGEAGDGAVRTILLPTDGSEGAEAAVAHAVSLAQAYDATIRVLAVADTKSYGTFTTGGAESVIPALEERCRENVAAARELITELCGEDGDAPPVETAVVRGFPAEEILRYAEEHGADLLVLGTHGRTGVGRVLLGSVAEKVVRTAPVPVVTVRGPAA